jgi:hypothetical protein
MSNATAAASPVANSNARSHEPQTLADLSELVVRSAGGPRQALSGLAERLERRAHVFERARDPRCVFARCEARLIRRLADALPNAAYDDPEWVALLTLRFAEHYLRALHERAVGELETGAWAAVFEAGEHRESSVLEALVLGMTAHMVHDLPLALCDAGLTMPDGRSRIRDFNEMNEVLGSGIEDVYIELTQRYDPWLGTLDRMLEAYDAILTNQGLRIARATAWYNAQRLLDPASHLAARAAMERAPAITLHALQHPPLWSVRSALRGARWLSNATRRWPLQRR